GEHSAVFVDLNETPQITKNARYLHTRMDIGVGKGTHKGERSGVLLEEPRAIINPFKEEVYQNGRRVKEPNEPMFTLTVVDRHGIVHRGRIRRLIPKECFRLQGFTAEQFEKVKSAGISDSQLYKLAGNSITVPVVEALARNLLKFDKDMNESKDIRM
ncbi:MAG: DNA cytosine methyltransferase, partial [Ruminococcus sp.]|nr:DNA cytosine methyltransferase [Ruminococcus sp.]